jgi:hypothetical protein
MVRGLRTLGGHLTVGEGSVTFMPHAFDRALRGEPWSLDGAEVQSVDIASRGLNPLNGSWRRRLLISSEDDRVYFVVPHVGRTSGDIRRILGLEPAR